MRLARIEEMQRGAQLFNSERVTSLRHDALTQERAAVALLSGTIIPTRRRVEVQT